MPSYVVDSKTGEVIYLNTDAPLAPGDPRNKQVAPGSSILGGFEEVYGPGKNYYVSPAIVKEVNKLPAYATGNSDQQVQSIEGIDDGQGGVVGLPRVLTAIPADDFLSALKQYAQSVWGGTSDLGRIRDSSAALENEPSGIRFGNMPRIVFKGSRDF